MAVPLTSGREDMLFTLHDAGWDPESIADEMRINPKTVMRYIRNGRTVDHSDVGLRLVAIADTQSIILATQRTILARINSLLLELGSSHAS